MVSQHILFQPMNDEKIFSYTAADIRYALYFRLHVRRRGESDGKERESIDKQKGTQLDYAKDENNEHTEYTLTHPLEHWNLYV